MTLTHADTTNARHRTPPEHTPRLRLKPKAPRTGCVDGAWWPHSADLAAELPDLLAVLSVRLGVIGRVMYNLAEWAKVPSRLATGGRTVRLDGYHRQPVNTIEVVGLDNARIALLVVAPQTEPDQAHATMMAAAGVDDASTVDGLLVVGAAG
jgi:Family of unknown function (DUF5994)